MCIDVCVLYYIIHTVKMYVCVFVSFPFVFLF